MRTLFGFAVLLGCASAFAQPPGAPRPAGPPAATPPPAPPPPAPPAPPPPALTAIDPDAVPAACRELALRAGSPNVRLAQTSRVSLALCVAQERAKQLEVCDCDQSVQQLDDAASPALAILDELEALGEPAWQLVAHHAEGELLDQLAQRVLASVPGVPAGANDDAIALHDLRIHLAQPIVQPWLDRARDHFAQVDRLANAHPELATTAVTSAAVADSRRRLAAAASR